MNSNYVLWIEAEIKKQKFGTAPSSLYDPIRYIMNLGGKRLRPILALLAYSLYKNDPKNIVKLAVAVEAFHNFTLLHDDIMDKAPLRRGKKTVHEKWSINTAILAGDVMLVRVYDLLLQVESKLLKDALLKFNACAAEVCEGQQWDMEFESHNTVSEKEYISMIRQKTAILLGFSLEFGAMLANAPIKDQKALRDFGIAIGIGFQLKDDWLDVYGDNKNFGKQVGGDILANKKTFLLITALAQAKGEDKKQLLKWLNASKFDNQKKVKAVTEIYNRLEVSSYSEKKINQYFRKGLLQLENLKVPDSKKKVLREFTLKLIDRIQ